MEVTGLNFLFKMNLLLHLVASCQQLVKMCSYDHYIQRVQECGLEIITAPWETGPGAEITEAGPVASTSCPILPHDWAQSSER